VLRQVEHLHENADRLERGLPFVPLDAGGELGQLGRHLERAGELLAERGAREAQLAAIVEASHDAIIGMSLDGTILSWNAAAERMYGYSAEEAVQRSVADLASPEEAAEMFRLLERIARGQRVESFETRQRTRSGAPIDVSVTLSPVRDAAGAVVGVSTIARDVTEQLAVEHALREAQDAYRLVFEHANEGLFYMTADGRTTAVNPALTRLMGFDSPDEYLENQDRLQRLWSAERRDELLRRLEAEGVVRGFEMEGEGIDGVRRCLSIDMVVVKDDAGRPAAYQGVVLDTTERKAAQEALNRASEEADRANRAKTEFLSA
jgi:PAS domain S-box-containing protein